MSWKDEIKHNIRTIEQLKKYIMLSPKQEKQLQKIIEKHPMSITRYYMSLINKNDPHDPIRKMVIPSVDELDLSGSYDPSGEMEITKMPGLQHKYDPTALILSTNRCATYCRYCFRKRLIGLSTKEIIHKFDEAVQYIDKHEEITNVLISGGDPFKLSSTVIDKFLRKLSRISHLYFIRFGTKVPIVLPQRIIEDDELLSVLKKYSLPERKIYISTQFNHPKEITKYTVQAVHRLLRTSGILMSSQTVLLKGINDDTATLVELLTKLSGIGVIPYYIFQCRPVKRVKQHFQVPLYRGLAVIEETKKRLSGYSKRFRFVMSHRTGKIEIVGIQGNYIYFKYHEARNPKNIGKLFKKKINKTAGWLDDL